MREKLFAIGDDFWIENESGQRALESHCQGASDRADVHPREPSGEELFKIQEKELRWDRLEIRVKDGGELSAQGDIVLIQQPAQESQRNIGFVRLNRCGVAGGLHRVDSERERTGIVEIRRRAFEEPEPGDATER